MTKMLNSLAFLRMYIFPKTVFQKIFQNFSEQFPKVVHFNNKCSILLYQSLSTYHSIQLPVIIMTPNLNYEKIFVIQKSIFVRIR